MSASPSLASRLASNPATPVSAGGADDLAALLFDDHPDPLLLLRRTAAPAFVIDKANRAAAALFATSVERLAGKPVAGILKSDSRLAVEQTLATAWDTAAHAQCDLALAGPDGGEAAARLHAAPYETQAGAPGLLVRILAGHPGASLGRSDGANMPTDKAEHLMAAVSHELRTPLNGILGFAEILKEELFGPLGQPRYQEYARDIYYCGDQLLRRVEDLLALKPGPPAPPEQEEDWFDATAPMEAAIDLARHVTERKGLRVGLVRDRTPIGLFGNEALFRRMVRTILLNCAEAAPDGSAIAIVVRPADDGGLAVAIQDDGAPVDSPRLADGADGLTDGQPFTTETRALTGLYSAERCARQLGGRLVYEAGQDDEAGQRIVFIIPQARVLAAG